MKRYTYLLAGVLLAITYQSCKKATDDNFTLSNSNPVTLTVDIYGNEPDYVYSSNAIIHVSISPNGSYTFPKSKLKEGIRYYVDAYSENPFYTNWVYDDVNSANPDSSTYKSFVCSSGNNGFAINVEKSIARNVLVNNNRVCTRWVACMYLDATGNNIWNTIPEYLRFQELYFYKNRHVECRYINNGDTVESTFSTKIVTRYNNSDSLFEILFNNNNWAAANTNVSSHSTYLPATKDSLLAVLDGGMFILKRQE